MSSTDEPPTSESLAASAKETGQSAYEVAYNSLLTGVAIIIPVIITLYVLRIGVDFVIETLQPFIAFLRWAGVIESIESVQVISFLIDIGVYSLIVDFLTELIALAILFGIVAVIGVVGRHQYGEKIIDLFDLAISSIPGIGTVYKSFRRMGDVVLDEGADEFQDVKLVQCFDDDVYVLGFQTGDSPTTIEDSTGHDEMVSMFLPMAPNPVTGGLLTYIPAGDVYDIDMTVEEGVRSILTSGVATDQDPDNALGVDVEKLRESTGVGDLREAVVAQKASNDEK